MTLLATMGLTSEQAVTLGRVIELVETATRREREQKSVRQLRNIRYYQKHKASDERLKPSESVLERLNSDGGRLNSDASRVARVQTRAKSKTSSSPSSDLFPPVDTDVSTAPKGADDAKDTKNLRGTRLAADWLPSEALMAEGVRLGLLIAQFNEVVEEFKNYWLALPGQRGRKLDWDRTFLNRLRDQAPKYTHRGAGNGRGSKGQRGSLVEAGLELINEERAREGLQPASREDFVDAAVRMLSRR